MLPFYGLAFSCTGIPSQWREDLSSKIRELGGTYYSDLMSDVKYLIVGDRRTEKYKYCVRKRFDVKFLSPSSIVEIFHKYKLNDNLWSLEQYFMDIFEEMSICVSRMDPFADLLESHFRRQFVSQHSDSEIGISVLCLLVQKHGGKVTDSLSQSSSCIVTTVPRGKRYDKALEWNIPVVHPIWVIDSCIRSASLCFSDYALGSDLNGCEVWDDFFLHQRKSKGPKKDSRIWNEIMQTKIERSTTREESWGDDGDGNDGDTETENETKNTSVIPFEEVQQQNSKEYGKENMEKGSLFYGLGFMVLGFEQKERTLVEQVLHAHGGEVVESADTTSHILVPAKLGCNTSHFLSKFSEFKLKVKSGELKIVTEWFIERSIYYNFIKLDSWGSPFKGLKPSPRRFSVCVTGFTGIELLHLEKLLTYLNFEFCPTLSASRDLLILNINLFKDTLLKSFPLLFEYKAKDFLSCPTYMSGTSSVSLMSSKNKISAAQKWQIPVVSVAYIWEALAESKMSSSPTLRIPNIRNPQWCIHAPNGHHKPETLLDYVKHLHDGPSENQEICLFLQSPKRSKQKRVYGRITGNRSSDLITRKSRKVDDEEAEQNLSLDEVNLPQIGYQDADSIKRHENLLQKLSMEKAVERHRT